MPDAEGLLLTQADNDILSDFIREWRRARRNPHRTPIYPELAQSPYVYLARSTAGIAAMTVEAGTGTDSSVGILSKDNNCRLFRIDDKDPNIDVDPIGIIRTVYNPSIVAVPANTLFLAVKTADGKFVAVQLGGGSGTGSTVEVIEPANDGATPPKPKLMSYIIDNYVLATDTVVASGAKVWARDANG